MDANTTTKTPTIDRVEQMKEIQKEALELFIKKNKDYGDAFAKYGIIGVIMRIEDKLQRMISITKNSVSLQSEQPLVSLQPLQSEPNYESLRDTLIDLHNYSAMALMFI